MKRILFVDDDVSVLSGLKRMLHGRRGEWEMVFVASGPLGLDELDNRPFDVIVSDMRMPGMDGAALLTIVAERHPGVVRLVLSGHAEEEVALRALPVTHQFINKPCDADTLKNRIERACALESLLGDAELRRKLGGVDSLPSLPKLYTQLAQAIADPKSSLRDVARLVEQDPGLSAKVLQVVNSAFFGLAQEMSSVSSAVTYLGLNMLQNLVLTLRVFEDVGGGLDSDYLQRHSLAVGLVARALLPRGRVADDAFAAGTLHDVGKLVLASKFAEPYREVIKSVKTDGLLDHDAELAVFNTHHGAVGGYLLGLWGLPHSIVEAVAWHHQPSAIPHAELGVLGAVHIADALVEERESGLVEENPRGLDMAYIESVHATGKVSAWRVSAATTLAARAA